MGSTERSSINPERLYSPLDRALGALRDRLFGKSRAVTVSVSIVLYAGAVLAHGNSLGVSANFIVLVPVICASMGYGLWAGLAAGTLGLPVNLALFAILGHPEYRPASIAMAEASGIILGTVLGYLSDYHRKLDSERELRKSLELELRSALRDREALFREVHHRVKNNLNLIKSIIGLQTRRSGDQEFRDATAVLTGRIMSISFVHERLYRTAELSAVTVDDYLADLVGAIATVAGGAKAPPSVSLDLVRQAVNMDVAVALGMIVNELATNAFKHGKPDGSSVRFEVTLKADGGRLSLVARDDGVGIPGIAGDKRLRTEEAALAWPGRLGFTLIDLMSAQLGGDGEFGRRDGWTEYRLSFPASDPA